MTSPVVSAGSASPGSGSAGSTSSGSASAGSASAPPAIGLSTLEAGRRLRADGPNAIDERGRRSYPAILAGQFTSPLVLLLMGASIVAISVGDAVDAGIILVIVVLSAGLGFAQEARSEAALVALRARLALQASVIRDGTERLLPARELVRGDAVVLNAGDIVPADGRLVEANHLYVDESALTGESAPALKTGESAAPLETGESALALATSEFAAPFETRDSAAPLRKSRESGGQMDDPNRAGLVFFGTSVVSGAGIAVLTATGRRTAYGTIAHRLIERAPRSDFERGVRSFGLLVTRVILILVVGVFAVDIALRRPLVESLLFAIALAVGLTPELLPAIVTVNLSRGAHVLARGGVLVRRLPAIQNLGSMTLLCTDKTGTLTQGRLTLERAVAADGAEAPSAIGLAWLNSHFETGFSNPLDIAILAHDPGPTDIGRYRKLAELPFDFERRMLGILVEVPDGSRLLVTKGAPESILARSSAVRTREAVVPLDADQRTRIADLLDRCAGDGSRTIAVATRSGLDHDTLEPSDEVALVFEAILVFSDPPKPDIGPTIADLRSLGIGLKIVTGDNEHVAAAVARQAGLEVEGILTGDQIRRLHDTAFAARAERTTIFARVDPDQKLRVIRALQARGAIVGYLGDGINDAPPLHVADVGISVDNGTDVARASADIVLLQPSLAVLARGVREGRRTFANTLKYIRMGISSNFGNMLSMAGAAVLLPFLPMLPSQILLNNLIYDASQTAIPSDEIDPETEAQPARWDIGGIERFMLVFGPISSLFDYATFGFLLAVLHAGEPEFHTGWFVESLASQVLVIFAIRTRRSPFWRSRPSRLLVIAAGLAIGVAVLLPLSPLAGTLGFRPLPGLYWLALALFVAAYLAIVEVVKRWTLEPARRRRTAGPAGTTATL